MAYAIGIDIGGTNFRLVLVNSKAQVLHRSSLKTGAHLDMNQTLNLITDEVKKALSTLKKKSKIILSLGMPGIVNPDLGIVYSSPHFPLWKNFKIKDHLYKKLKIPILVDNDAHMAARGEFYLGAAKNIPTFIMLTLGTGIGGAFMFNNQIINGTRGFGGEFGHIVVNLHGGSQSRGWPGTMENTASAFGISNSLNWAIKAKKPGYEDLEIFLNDPDLVFHLSSFAKKGNALAQSLFDEFAIYLGAGLASLVHVTGAEVIILGGGLMNASSLFLNKAVSELKSRSYAEVGKNIKIIPAKLKEDAGLMGASYWGLVSKKVFI